MYKVNICIIVQLWGLIVIAKNVLEMYAGNATNICYVVYYNAQNNDLFKIHKKMTNNFGKMLYIQPKQIVLL